MKIGYIHEKEISKILNFNDKNGKYEKRIGDYKVELNSWNKKLFVKEEQANNDWDIEIPIEIIETIVKIDRMANIEFEKKDVEKYYE